MSNGRPFQGSLFAEDFLRESIVDLPDWQDFDELMLDGRRVRLAGYIRALSGQPVPQ